MPMVSSQEISRSFETVPSYERVKNNTIDLLMQITNRLAEMNKYQLLGRNDRMTKLGFVADVITFYSYLRPKILDHVRRKHDSALKEFVAYMDRFVLHPNNFNETYALLAYAELNDFCEKYRLTSTTIYRSTLDTGTEKSL